MDEIQLLTYAHTRTHTLMLPNVLLLLQHKTMRCWVYDKRPRNGSQFVYFGMLPIDPQSEEAKVLIPYMRGVLDALGMAHGVS